MTIKSIGHYETIFRIKSVVTWGKQLFKAEMVDFDIILAGGYYFKIGELLNKVV